MRENAVILVKYALACQDLGIVPIIEPEVLIDGDYDIEKCYEVTARNFDILFSELESSEVFVPGLILKPNMVIAGKNAPKASHEDVARMTLRCLREHVAPFIGGIVFLSGGQDSADATMNLNAMHQESPLPWPLTFSYARAIQNPALEAWAKNPLDVAGAQKLLLMGAKNNSDASIGKYKQ